MKNKLICTISTCLLINCVSLFAQNSTVILDYNVNGNQNIVARDAIVIKPGFKYTPAPGVSLIAKIDEAIVTNTEYLSNPVSPISNSISTSAAVGLTQGSANVSPTGAASYQIPIFTPQGIAGMQPSISIVYNSQGGSSVLGVGWSMSGLSAISRVPRTIFNNDAVRGINFFDNNSDFALDGNRLLALYGGLYGGENTAYETEIKTFSTIATYGLTQETNPVTNTARNTGPSWFKVISKDSKIIEYGNSDNSKLTPGGKPTPYMWLINKITDPNGNFMTFTYKKLNGEVAIEKIDYTGNGSSTPSNSMLFFYELKSDSVTSYIGGRSIKNNLLLRRIKINTEGVTVRTYDFTYNNNNKKTFLNIIKEIGGDNIALNSTIIGWGTDNTTIEVKKFSGITFTNPSDIKDRYWTSGDVNSDGRSELICAYASRNVNPNISSLFEHNIDVFTSQTNGTFVKSQHYNVAEGFPYSWTKAINTPVMIGDLDGQGKRIIVYTHALPNPILTFEVLGTPIKYERPLSMGGMLHNPAVTMGDYNNDGKDELVYFEVQPKDDEYKINMFYTKNTLTGASGDECKWKSVDVNIGYRPEYVINGDYNNDGLLDMLVICDGSYVFLENLGSTKDSEGYYVTSFNSRVNANSFNSHNSCIRPGDFNGDGLIDIIVNGHSTAIWYLFLNNGNWGFNQTTIPNITAVEESYTDKNNDNDGCLVFDINHDGKSDLLIVDSEYERDHDIGGEWGDFTGFSISWYLSTGKGFELYKPTLRPNIPNYVKIKDFAIGDFNGDGKEDIINYGTDLLSDLYTNVDNYYRFYSTFNTSDPLDDNLDGSLVNTIADGFNNKTSFTYQPISFRATDTESFYTKGTSSHYPKRDIQEAISCVKTVKSPNGVGGWSTSEYSYENARVHLTGKGFLGFTKMTTVNPSANSKVVSTSDLEDLTCLPKTQTSSVETASGSVVSYTVNSSKNQKIGNSYFSYNVNAVSTNYLTGITSTTTYNYNATDGNLYGVKTSNSDGLGKETTYQSYILGKPQRVTSTQKHPDDGMSFSLTTSYGYDSKGNLTSEVANDGTGKEITTSFSNFDSWGHPLSISTSTATYNNTKIIVFDSKGRYIKEVSDNAGTATTEYDPVLLTLTSSTAVNGLKTTYKYDLWGNLVGTYYPDGNAVTNSISWGNVTVPSEPLYYTMTSSTNGPWSKQGFDAMGREVYKETVGYNGLSITSQTKYNAKGQVEQHTSKSGGNTTSQVNYSYMDDGRVLSETHLNGKTVQHTYPGNKVTQTINGKVYEKTYDSWGNVKIVKEPAPGGEIFYTYSSNGKPKIISYPGAKVQMTYDNIGNQITLKDPSSGNLEYTYDALGRLTKQKDARGKETLINYDNQGRITDKKNQIGETIAEYTYFNSGAEKGQVQKVTNPKSNTWDSYEYDNLGRQVKATSHIEGISDIIFQNHYDDKGNIDQITYPSGYVVTQQYDQYGNLEGVKGGGSSIWVLNTMTESEMSYTLGNGLATKKQFNAYGMLTSVVTNGQVQVQNLNYTYDIQKGLMESREDSRSGYSLKEKFVYDEIDRLTNWSVSKNGLLTNAYSISFDNDSVGNITQKTDVGAYHYGGSTPHAVRRVVPGTSGYLPLAQDLTYTDFGKVKTIAQNGYLLDITYGTDDQRVKSELKQGSTTIYTNYYAGLYEVKKTADGKVKEYLYIPAGDGVAAVLVKTSGAADSLFYVHKDHLGSITCLTRNDGTIREQMSYDPWGRYCNPRTWDFTNVKTPTVLTRGFTGHEHLNEFTLINMNGRVYDPMLGMFISPDPFIQAPDYSQNYNRYNYCLNNPLSYNDPSGEFWHIIIGGVVGGVVNLATNWKNCDGFWEFATAFAVGAGAGAVTAATGGAGAGFWATAGVSALGSAITTGTNSIIAQTGKNFSGMGNVDWGEVTVNSGIGGFAGFAGSAAGQYAAKFSMINGINSPILKSLAVSPIGAGVGHIAGGTAAGMMQGKSFDDAFSGSFKGIGESMAIGTALGVTSTVANCYFNGMNPLNGKMLWPKNSGFNGTPQQSILRPGVMIDRYGSEDGRYASPQGTSLDARSLPPSTSLKPLNTYKVIRPIPVTEGSIASSFWFNSSGGGTQYMFNNSIEYYRINGYLIKIP